MGTFQMGVPRELVIDLRDATGASCFVETGTYRGGTARWASDCFQSFLTIEKAESIHRSTSKALGHLTNVRFLLGDSRDQLPALCADIAGPAIFWLDGHWSGGMTAGADEECPLMAELDAIFAARTTDVILIDDARLFLSVPPPPHKPESWPTLSDIAEVFRSQNYWMQVFRDVICAVPADQKLLRDCVKKHAVEATSQWMADISEFKRLRQETTADSIVVRGCRRIMRKFAGKQT